jgi:hypothetical protein
MFISPAFIVCFTVAMLIPMPGPSQYGEVTASPLFRSDYPLALTLSMDLREVLWDNTEDREEHPARISYVSNNGDTVVVPLKVRTRGHFRRKPTNCDFPPLRLNFASEICANTVFEGQDKLKLVTHCRSRGSHYEQNVLDEYLAYRLYNLFTEESYRVRLVDLVYADQRGRKDTVRKLAFLIESDEQMAARNQGTLADQENIRHWHCDPYKIDRLSVFQYMIGNTDWSIPAGHNLEFLSRGPRELIVAVPFDFDWCGLVDAPYAIPSPILGLPNVRTRLYRGHCRSEEEFELVFREFREKKSEIFRTIESLPFYEDRDRKKAIQYIEDFYKVLDNPRRVKFEFYENCRGY